MARLHVDVTARWAQDGEDFRNVGILLAASVSDDAGIGVPELPASAFQVRYQDGTEDAFTCDVSDFHEHGLALAGGAAYSFLVNPGNDYPAAGWVQDELFLYVMVRAGGNHGQTVCMARNHRISIPTA